MRFDISLQPSRVTIFIASVTNCVATKWCQAEESCDFRSENLKFHH